jgi:hypothetical protein
MSTNVQTSYTTGQSKRFKKKQLATSFNENYVSPEMDPKKYDWNRKCSKCYGRGYIGIVSNTFLIPCKCATEIVSSEVKELVK